MINVFGSWGRMAWVGALVLAFSVVPHSVVSTASATSHVITLLGSDIDGEAAGDVSGAGVSMSTDGSRVAIGAYGNDGNGADSGHVRIYDWNSSTWTQVGSDIDGEAAADRSGGLEGFRCRQTGHASPSARTRTMG